MSGMINSWELIVSDFFNSAAAYIIGLERENLGFFVQITAFFSAI